MSKTRDYFPHNFDTDVYEHKGISIRDKLAWDMWVMMLKKANVSMPSPTFRKESLDNAFELVDYFIQQCNIDKENGITT